ncbi:MAG: GxxExxY protein [Armatimonadetes bacterium]|nr:GxxExxY protein [Armatimonadota bacterium]
MEARKNGEERQAKVEATADATGKTARLSPELERIGAEVVDAAYTVHSTLGPGLLESVYETCLAHELTQRGLAVRTQVAMPVVYKGIRIEAGYRLDMLVEEVVVVEVKAVEMLATVHIAQLRTYLKLAGLQLGLAINFNVARIKDGIRRVAIQSA